MHKTSKTQMSTHELLLRRYKSDLRRLKQLVVTLDVELHNFDAAVPSDICVLSKNDAEIEEHKLRCSSSNDGYFISQKDYDEYEEFHSFIDEQV